MVFAFVLACATNEEVEADAPLAAADVVVVGAGPAGLAAAWEAAERGRSVLVVDLADNPGGTALWGEAYTFAAGTEVQEALGVVDSPDAAAAEWYEITGVEADSSAWVARYLAAAPTEVIGWLLDLGVVFDNVLEDPDAGSVARLHHPEGGGAGLLAPLIDARKPDELWMATAVTGLRVDDTGRVVGVATGDGASASGWIEGTATVLATGGFLQDKERVVELVPSLAGLDDVYLAAGDNARGDGLQWGEDLGAATGPLERIGFYADGVPSYVEGEEHGAAKVGSLSLAVIVGDDGQRFFDESRFGSFRAGREMVDSHGGDAWAVFDSAGAAYITFADLEFTPDAVTLEGLVSRGSNAFVADDLASLAEATGLPPDTLAATVDRYNGFFGAERVDLDLGKNLEQSAPLLTPPFYAVRLVAAAAKNFGGLSTGDNGEILDEGGEPIAGLYGAGELVGMAGGDIGGWGFGGSIGACLYSARVAGAAAASP
ncbi:MAG: FAD-binding protein [Deltaproteobacteria bacterium]|nr:FAD-binding protein [Deltaproteobacteria bacterium]